MLSINSAWNVYNTIQIIILKLIIKVTALKKELNNQTE